MQGQLKKPPEDNIRIRPHHGLCGEFFQGKGYSGEFVENMSAVLDRLNESDPPVTLTIGADMICCRCPHSKAKPCTIITPTINEYKEFNAFSPLKVAAWEPIGICETEEKVSRYDNAVLRLCGLSEGDILTWWEFRGSVREKIISPGLLSQVCGDCIWFDICGKE